MSKEIAIRHGDGGRLEEGQDPASFLLLGAFQMTAGEGLRWPGPEQEQRLLAKLLAANAMPVPKTELMEAIWDEVPGPGATLEALYHLVAKARRRLAAAGLEGVLTNTNGTYQLAIPAAQVDIHVFHALIGRARELAHDADQQAVELLEEALRLRRGEPLAGLRGRWVDGYRYTLAGELREAELAVYETAIRHGQSRVRLPGLSALLRERPDDELVAWLYMHALYRAGQQTQALAVKRQFSEYLLETNGVENGKALDDLYQRILDKDDSLLAPEAVSFPAGGTGTQARRPGRPGPGAAQESGEEGTDGTREDPYDSPHAEEDGRQGAAQGPSDRHAVGAQPIQVFNGRVDAPHGVFGIQINHGDPR